MVSTRKGTRGAMEFYCRSTSERENLLLACLALNYTPSIPFLRPFYTAEDCINRRVSDSVTVPRTGIEHAPPCREQVAKTRQNEISLWTVTGDREEKGERKRERGGCKTRDILLPGNWYVNERKKRERNIRVWKGGRSWLRHLLCSRARHPFPALRHLQHPRLTGSSWTKLRVRSRVWFTLAVRVTPRNRVTISPCFSSKFSFFSLFFFFLPEKKEQWNGKKVSFPLGRISYIVEKMERLRCFCYFSSRNFLSSSKN